MAKSRAAGVVEIEMSIDGRQVHTDASGPMVSLGPGRSTACAVAACGGRAEVGAMSQGAFVEFHAPLAAGSEHATARQRADGDRLRRAVPLCSDVGITGTVVSRGRVVLACR